MKKIIAAVCILAVSALLMTACSVTTTTPTQAQATQAATQATTQATTTAAEEDPVQKLQDISNDVTKLWNEVFVEARDYAKTGKSCTGDPLDIDFVIANMDKYYNKVTEDKEYMDSLGDEYSDIKLAFDKLYDKATIIYNNLKEETPVANQPLSYADEIDLFQQYHTYFYDAVNELAWGT